MTDRRLLRDGATLLGTILLASWLPAVLAAAPSLPDVESLVPGVGLAVVVGLALAGYEYRVGDLAGYATTRVRALLYAVFAFYVTATVTFLLVAWRVDPAQIRSLPVVAWTVLSGGVVALLVRRRIRARDRPPGRPER